VKTKKLTIFWRTFEYLAFGFLIFKALVSSNIFMDRFLGIYEIFLLIGIFLTLFSFICLCAKPGSANIKTIEKYFKNKNLLEHIDPMITFGMGIFVWIFLGDKSLSLLLICNPFFSHLLKEICKKILSENREKTNA